ncbi:Serine:threonine protein phosphatase 2A 65 kDa [Echinococcus multilocularis]|uniref:Serine:threonine protein phosphatase 2A 65 kDa n=1 Tax=Echinococcus multilocularis TaxID=6211 RepID=A0A068YJ33_ECHMU|nr:Serine:threonine protein phosphatase 2A 65 kDa [Echinococcus multilocularis]
MSVVEAVLQTLSTLKFESTSAEQSDPRPTAFDNETLETAEKLRVFQSLPTIAKNLGVEECQKTLVPMLGDLVQKAIGAGDDEVLMVIAQKLPDLADVLGSDGEGASSLIPIISEILVFVEEIVVVQAAADAFCAILPHLSAEQIDKKALPLIRKLHEEDLFCASRKVVSKMMTTCYPLVPAKVESELKCRLIHLADNEDEVPLVRSAAIYQLVTLARLIGNEFKAELSPLLAGLVGDSQRIVRAACVEPILELGKMLNNNETTEYETMVQASLDKLNEDGSRDTRRALASNMAELQKIAISRGGSSKSLHTMMMNLLEDNEVETRRIAASQFKDFCLASPKDVQTDFLLPRLQEHLNMEREERVRSELVCCAVGLLPSARVEDCLPLVRPILAFLNHNLDQPKQYVFEYFSQLMSFIPSSEIQLTILPSLVNLWQGKNWRVRLGVVQSLPCLFATLPESCLRETILPSTLAWLLDPTWAVRDCACRSLARLLSVCPSAATDAIMGTGGGGGDKDVGTGVTSSPPSATISSSIVGSVTSASALTSADASGDAGNTGTGVGVGGAISIATLTANAAARGLRALASDSNYHLRQIFILAVQALWGPGIPEEPSYSALGDLSPNVGLISPALLYDFALRHHRQQRQPQQQQGKTPDKCAPPPTGLPAAGLQTCLQLLLQLLTADPVPNVRFAAARALVIISASLEAKATQKQVIPALKKVLEEEKDFDVRFYAQDALKVFDGSRCGTEAQSLPLPLLASPELMRFFDWSTLPSPTALSICLPTVTTTTIIIFIAASTSYYFLTSSDVDCF